MCTTSTRRVKPISASTRWRSGFTLIELMVAIVILSVITSVVYITFDSVIRSTETVRDVQAELEWRSRLSRSLTENLAQAYDPWLPGAGYRAKFAPFASDGLNTLARFWLLGEDAEGPDGPSDTLTFATTAPLPAGVGMPGVFKQVTYRLTASGGAEDEGNALSDDAVFGSLEISESPVQQSMLDDYDDSLFPDTANEEFEAGASPSWSIPVRTLNFRYFDGDEWVDEWDSRDRLQLPWCVEVRVNFARTEEELEAERNADYDVDDDPDLLLVISLPAGIAVRGEPPAYNTSGTANGFQGPQDV